MPMIVVKHVDSIFGSLLPIRLSTFKLVSNAFDELAADENISYSGIHTKEYIFS